LYLGGKLDASTPEAVAMQVRAAVHAISGMPAQLKAGR
jgi:hypothetical protein